MKKLATLTLLLSCMSQAWAGISIKMNEPQSPEEQQAKMSIQQSGINQCSGTVNLAT